jgi:hypothetical protein
MAYEKQIKRTIYVAQCGCGERDVKDDNSPRERLCKCGSWVHYKEESYTGPELNDNGR